MIFLGPGDRAGPGDHLWSAQSRRHGQKLPFQSTPRPPSEAQTGRAPRAMPVPVLPRGHTRNDALPACLPGQVSAFSHQLLERWALECCLEAPWPHSTWRFTHPSLNLILGPFHSSSHAVFTKISPPRQTKHKTRVPWAAWGMFPQPGEPLEHRTQVATLQTVAPATHSGVKDPSLHFGGDSCSQGQENLQATSEKEGLFLWVLQIIIIKKKTGKGG